MNENKINIPNRETKDVSGRPELHGRGTLEAPERAVRDLAQVAARNEEAVITRQDIAVETSAAIYEGAQQAGIDAGEPLYDENGNLIAQPVAPASSQAGLAAVRHL